MTPESVPISRREFLKGAAGGAAFLTELLSSEKALAALEDLLPKYEFIPEGLEQGFERLRKDVFEKEAEQYYVFIRKGQHSGWLNIVESANSFHAKTIDVFKIFEDAGVEYVHFSHTHPWSASMDILRFPRNTKLVDIFFVFPPSGMDIFTAVRYNLMKEMNKSKVTIKNSVLDISGVWSFEVDMQHPRIKKFADAMRAGSDKGGGAEKLFKQLITEVDGEQHERLREDPTKGVVLKRINNFQQWAKTNWGVHQTFSLHQERKP